MLNDFFKRGQSAFTIIELMVAVLIISILITTASFRLKTVRQHARDGRRLGDILLITRIIDQSMVINRGAYPKNAGGGSDAVMCAGEMYSSSNPNNLDLTVFPYREIPTDPLAYLPLNSGCTGMNNGYTYHSNYPGTGSSLADDHDLVYVLEVGLEREKPVDDTSFRKPSQVDIQGATDQDPTSQRYRYLLPGNYCGPSCY